MLIEWILDVPMNEARPGDICFFVDASGKTAHSEIVRVQTSPDARIWVKRLDYMPDSEPEQINVLDEKVVRIERHGSYDAPETPGLYFDKNRGLYYLSDELVWHFLMEPKGSWQTQREATIIDLHDVDPNWFPFIAAKAVVAE